MNDLKFRSTLVRAPKHPTKDAQDRAYLVVLWVFIYGPLIIAIVANW